MSHRDLRRAGHWPTLLCAFLYFETSFMIWVVLGALGNILSVAFHLEPAQEVLLVGLPILGGACFMVVMGVLADRIGPRRAAMLGMALTAVPLLLGWLWANSFSELLLVGLLLGVSGASFAVALPMASRWYPMEKQGLVLGLAGLGMGGMALATLIAPRLIPMVGWRGVFGLALIPLAIVFLIFAALARDAPMQPAPRRLRDSLGVLGLRDIYWYCGFHAITFGGFVGLSAFLPIYIRDQYGVDPIRAGLFTTFCALAGSLLRPVGGYLADRIGGVMVLVIFFVGLGLMGLLMSYIPHLETAALYLFLTLALLGMGNGAVFQLVPQRFGDAIGVVTGLVGAAGGLGGFVLPLILGFSRQWTGRFGPGFFLIGMVGFAASGLLLQASRTWQEGRTSSLGRSGHRRAEVVPAHE